MSCVLSNTGILITDSCEITPSNAFSNSNPSNRHSSATNCEHSVAFNECVCRTAPIDESRLYSCRCKPSSAEARFPEFEWPLRSTCITSSSCKRPLSVPDTVIATSLSARRIEKLPLVAGTHPLAKIWRPVVASDTAAVASFDFIVTECNLTCQDSDVTRPLGSPWGKLPLSFVKKTGAGLTAPGGTPVVNFEDHEDCTCHFIVADGGLFVVVRQ